MTKWSLKLYMQVCRLVNVNILTFFRYEKLALEMLGKCWRIGFGPGIVPLKFPMYLLQLNKSNVFNQDNLENLALGLYQNLAFWLLPRFYGNSLEIYIHSYVCI